MAVSRVPIVAYFASATGKIGKQVASSTTYTSPSSITISAPKTGKPGEVITVGVSFSSGGKTFRESLELVVPEDWSVASKIIKIAVDPGGKTSQFFASPPTFTITYVSAYNQPEARKVDPNEFGEYALTAEDLPQLKDDEHRLEGWYKDAAFTFTAKASEGTVISEDTTLYAKWEEKQYPNKVVQPRKLIGGTMYNLMYKTIAGAVTCEDGQTIEQKFADVVPRLETTEERLDAFGASITDVVVNTGVDPSGGTFDQESGTLTINLPPMADYVLIDSDTYFPGLTNAIMTGGTSMPILTPEDFWVKVSEGLPVLIMKIDTNLISALPGTIARINNGLTACVVWQFGGIGIFDGVTAYFAVTLAASQIGNKLYILNFNTSPLDAGTGA